MPRHHKFRKLKKSRLEFENLLSKTKKKVQNYKYRYNLDFSDYLPELNFDDIPTRVRYNAMVDKMRGFLSPKAVRIKAYEDPYSGEKRHILKSEYDAGKDVAEELYKAQRAMYDSFKDKKIDIPGAAEYLTVEELAKVAPKSDIGRLRATKKVDINSMTPDAMRGFIKRYENPWAVQKEKMDRMQENFIARLETVLNNHGYDKAIEKIIPALEKMDRIKFTDLFYTTDLVSFSDWREGTNNELRGNIPIDKTEYERPDRLTNDTEVSNKLTKIAEYLGISTESLYD